MPFQQKTSSKYTCRPRRVDNVIQSIASLVEHDPYVDHALLCNATTPYISKLPGDGCGAGHLCGYYNAQMLLSTLTGTTDSENEALSLLVKNGIPDILSLQRQLEHAWDSGIDPHRRELIGPVASTSKHIGTAEVQAILESLKVPSSAESFVTTDKQKAHEALVSFVLAYFSEADTGATDAVKCRVTGRPPIYLQRPGHSMTIVGVERRRDGTCSLVAFDPGSKISAAFKAYHEKPGSAVKKIFKPAALLRQFSLDASRLKRFSAFEALSLSQ